METNANIANYVNAFLFLWHLRQGCPNSYPTLTACDPRRLLCGPWVLFHVLSWEIQDLSFFSSFFDWFSLISTILENSTYLLNKILQMYMYTSLYNVTLIKIYRFLGREQLDTPELCHVDLLSNILNIIAIRTIFAQSKNPLEVSTGIYLNDSNRPNI